MSVAEGRGQGRRIDLGLLLGAKVLFWASLYVYVPVLPIYAQQLGASLGLVGLVVGAYGFSQMVLRIPLGVASDRLGRRKPFLIGGMLANAAGCLTMALAPVPGVLVAGRAILGVGASTYVISSIYLADFFPRHELARATSLAVLVSSTTQVAVLLAGGFVADRAGVGATFWIGVALALAGVLVLTPLREVNRAPGGRPVRAAALARAALRRDVLVAAAIAALLQYGAFALTYGFVPVYAKGLGATAADLGVLATVAVGAGAIAALGMAALGARVHARLAVIAGFLIAAVSAAVIPSIGDLAVLTASQALGGFGRGLVFPALMAASIQRVDARERGAAMGTFQAIYAAGMFLGPTTAGALADWLGLDRVFLIVAGLSALGALGAGQWLERGPRPERTVTHPM